MSDNDCNITKLYQNKHLDDIYKSIIMVLRSYMEKNIKDEFKLKKKLKEIYFNIQNIILEEPEKEIKNLIDKNLNLEEEIKELKYYIKELKDKAIFIPEEKDKKLFDIKSIFYYLKAKLKEKNEKLKNIEFKYLYYIKEQNKKISELEEKLFKISLKNLP